MSFKAIWRSRNFARKINTNCCPTTPHLSIGGMSGGDLPPGVTVNHDCRVYLVPNGTGGEKHLFLKLELYGHYYMGQEEMERERERRGYVLPYCRNWCQFVSNRSFRKHTGQLAYEDAYFYLRKVKR